MLRVILFFSITLFISSCGNKKKKELTEIEKQTAYLELAEYDLEYQKEKIVLLSFTKNVPYDTFYNILRDYYVITNEFVSNEDTIAIVSQKAITSISKKYNYSTSKVASLIFSFKFETKTEDEIIEEFIENEAQRAAEEQEEYDPRY